MPSRRPAAWLIFVLVLGLVTTGAVPALAAPEGTGRVSGRITDAATGAPIPGICVDVLTPAGELRGRGFSDAHGRYTATGRLWPGSYLVEVNGCPNDRNRAYTREVWPNARQLADATPVVVASEMTTTGIDEDLVGSTDSGVYYVATDGVDTRRPACPGGTIGRPWRTIEHGMRCLKPGETLYVRGGTYKERVLPVVRPGRRKAAILVAAFEDERVLVRGMIRLEGADHWTVDGIDVTSDGRRYADGEYLVKFRDGVGWQFLNGEVGNVHAFAAFRVETGNHRKPEPANWRIANSCIHTTRPTHAPYQDHNLYVNTGLNAGPGLIERNIMFNARNGQNIKVGTGSGPTHGAANVTIRYNTLWGGVQNILASYGTRNIVVERNILGGVRRPSHKRWYPSVRGYHLRGGGNKVRNNIGHGGRAADFIANDRESSRGWRDAGGNRFPVAPRFDRTGSCRGFHPRNALVKWFGRYGPLQTVKAMAKACPGGEVPRDLFRDDDHSIHEFAIDCLAWNGVAARGRGKRFEPHRNVSRAQMASFIARMLEAAGAELPARPRDHFRDDRGGPHERRINQLAEIGVVGGVAPRRYGPTRTVSRGQMATFLVRAYEYASGSRIERQGQRFRDHRTIHRRSIERAAAAGFVSGVGRQRYAPGKVVRRDQMATALARTLSRLR